MTIIRQLNDAMRRQLPQIDPGNRVFLTAAVAALPPGVQADLLQEVQHFSRFCEGNDPYGEHDFGAIDMADKRYFWKIDYYDRSLRGASPDAANLAVTSRVLTLMGADEY